MPSAPAPDPAEAVFSVVRGQPSAEEVAALTAVLGALQLSASKPATTPAHRSLWSARDRLTRPVLRPGPGAWRASALP